MPEPEPETVAEPVEPVVEPAPAEPAVAVAQPEPEVPTDPVETAALPEPVETAPLAVPAARRRCLLRSRFSPSLSRLPQKRPRWSRRRPRPRPQKLPRSEEPATGSACSLDNLYNVMGFNENSNDLTTRVTDRLDQIIKDIGDETCTLQLTGYSSTQGDFATNALFAVERAQNVLRYLRENGLKYATATAVGAGETDQFGPAFSDNRRVVITVAP